MSDAVVEICYPRVRSFRRGSVSLLEVAIALRADAVTMIATLVIAKAAKAMRT